MNTAIILSLILFVLFWGSLYFLLRTRPKDEQQTNEYTERLHSALSEMFYNVSKTQIYRTVIGLTIAGALLGFFLPGKVSEIEYRMSIERAVEYNQNQMYSEAVLQLERLRGIDSPLVHNELGVAYLGLRNYAQAEKKLMQAIRLMPHYGKAHQNIAELYTLMGRHNDASFAEARARESDNFVISEERLYNLSSNITDQLGIRLFLAALLGYAAFNFPKGTVAFLRWRRSKKFESQLADGLVMISNGLRAGLSLVQAIEMLAREGKPPVSQEFELVLREHKLGATIGDSLKNLARRMPGNDTRIMVNAALILLESGGNLPERFDSLASTMQERKKVQQKIKTMTAEGVTQAWILAVLPLIIALLLNTMNNEVFRLMYTTIPGWMVSTLVALMIGTGVWWMMRIVKVKI